MKILITGASGFLGSNLTKKLAEENEIIAMDNNITGRQSNLPDNIKFLEKDITEELDISEIGEVDQIYHLASPASPPDYQKWPVKTMLVNAFGTLNVLKLAEKLDARMLFSSTSEIYGDPKVHPQPETYWGNVNPIGPRSMYDESKRFAEALISCYPYKNTRIVRIFNTYGPQMRRDDGRAMPNFITQSLSNKPITIYGDGKQTRSFCYVDDLIKGIVIVMNSSYNKPVNLGNPDEITILELAEKIKELTNSNSEIVHKELPKDDPVRRCPDITRAKKLGWKPETSLEKGLEKTIKYFSSVL